MRLFKLVTFFLLSLASCVYCSEAKPYYLNLQECEMMALSQNRQILALNELYKKAKEGKFESISKWLPKIMAISDLFTNQEPQIFPAGKHNTFLTQLSLTQAVFSADKYYDVKLAALQATHLDLLLQALHNDILFNVRSLYYKISLDHEMIANAKEHIDILRNLSDEMQYHYNIGTTILLNVNQAKVAVANATTIYYRRIKDLKSDRDALSELLGYNPGEYRLEIEDDIIPLGDFDELVVKLDKVDEIFNNPINNNTLIYSEGYPKTKLDVMDKLYSYEEIESWEKIAEKFNPILRTQFNEVAIANQEVSKQVGKYFPKVDFVANFGGQPNPYNFYPENTIGSQQFQWGVGVQATWLIFDSFGRESRLKQSRYERNSKQFDYQHSKQTTLRLIRDQIYSIEESVANFATNEGNVILADQTLSQARDQFEIGYITIYDFQIAVNGLIEAKNKLSESAYDLVHAYYGLRHCSGIDVKAQLEKEM
ncbi:MAG: TolC family protein [Rhabdochlamydiaceae bacterium]|nr:TolC family protein [Candidatus Amphrikana amoebophyrae]